MTAVIYARYSSDNQREESIEGQIRECTAYAEKNGITIVKHYIDRAISAKTDNRPQFQQIIKDSDKKLFDIVLVWKLDRFARNRYDSARYKTQLKKNGVKLMSATEIISEGPEGIILELVLEGYAKYYSADLAEKVVRGQTENILKGRCNGGRGTFGYTLDSERKFHIDSLASPFVLESFRKYRDGLTMKEIRDWLLRFRKLNMNQKDQRQALVDTFINSIYLYDDKVLINFNYKEGTQTVTFEEAAEAASKGIGSDLDCIPAQKKKRHTNVCSPVDIPTGWEPRTKQQPTGLLLTLLRRAVLFKSSYPHKKRKDIRTYVFSWCG